MTSLVLEEPGGTITVTAPVLANLVTHAAEEIEGVRVRRGRRRLEIDLGGGSARVRLELAARYGVVLDHHVPRDDRGDRRVGGGSRVSGGRRAARRTALFLLYQWDVTGQPLASLYEGEVDPFARETAEAVAAEAPELDSRITEAAEDWTADRLGAIERNILRIALHELDGNEVPDEVAINEAVTLAKRYATDDAARLVNGILGRIVRERVS
jgi:transcription antitermination factor NusB